MKSSLNYIVVLFLGMLLSGCALITGKPTPPVDVEIIADRAKKRLEDASVDKITTEKIRNGHINDGLVAIDLRYTQFLSNAGLQQRSLDVTSDFVQLSLNLAGAAVGGAGLKTILSALSAGISGTELGFNKAFLYEQTVPALVMQMDADRAAKRREILLNMNKNLNDYTWAEAVNDLTEYYIAGTLQSAINTIKKEAGYNRTIAENDIKEIKKIPTSKNTADKKKLTLSLNSIDTMDDSGLNKIKDEFKPISESLAHLPNCKKLETVSSTAKNEIKTALQNCIRDIGTVNNPSMTIDEELTVLDSKFRAFNLISE